MYPWCKKCEVGSCLPHGKDRWETIWILSKWGKVWPQTYQCNVRVWSQLSTRSTVSYIKKIFLRSVLIIYFRSYRPTVDRYLHIPFVQVYSIPTYLITRGKNGQVQDLKRGCQVDWYSYLPTYSCVDGRCREFGSRISWRSLDKFEHWRASMENIEAETGRK